MSCCLADQSPVFLLADGATVRKVILGAPDADGIHCAGSCTIENVWWEDVGEDAATFLGTASAKYTVSGGGAEKADDKVEDFGRLYRSCGNCKSNSTSLLRKVVVQNVKATAPGKILVGVNYNYGDSATLTNVTISGSVKKICAYYTGNHNGAEPPLVKEYAATKNGNGKYWGFKTTDVIKA